MRRHRPIAYVPETGRVWITTWDLCDEAGRNDKVFGPTREVFHAVYGNPNVMSLSGAEHLAHRAALNACFRLVRSTATGARPGSYRAWLGGTGGQADTGRLGRLASRCDS